ncbi:hypothetical protein OF83DRAFT_1088024 [Amylostereum chailletii]|nr:hypothetical protein OF83DRAFT_1088024 [Amylostereum chailletii]
MLTQPFMAFRARYGAATAEAQAAWAAHKARRATAPATAPVMVPPPDAAALVSTPPQLSQGPTPTVPSPATDSMFAPQVDDSMNVDGPEPGEDHDHKHNAKLSEEDVPLLYHPCAPVTNVTLTMGFTCNRHGHTLVSYYPDTVAYFEPSKPNTVCSASKQTSPGVCPCGDLCSNHGYPTLPLDPKVSSRCVQQQDMPLNLPTNRPTNLSGAGASVNNNVTETDNSDIIFIHSSSSQDTLPSVTTLMSVNSPSDGPVLVLTKGKACRGPLTPCRAPLGTGSPRPDLAGATIPPAPPVASSSQSSVPHSWDTFLVPVLPIAQPTTPGRAFWAVIGSRHTGIFLNSWTIIKRVVKVPGCIYHPFRMREEASHWYYEKLAACQQARHGEQFIPEDGKDEQLNEHLNEQPSEQPSRRKRTISRLRSSRTVSLVAGCPWLVFVAGCPRLILVAGCPQLVLFALVIMAPCIVVLLSRSPPPPLLHHSLAPTAHGRLQLYFYVVIVDTYSG